MQQSPSRDAVLNRDRGGWTKRLLLGRALASHKAEHQLLPKLLALPVFASDQLSSVAYATEEMLLVLVLVGASGLSWLSALSVGVAALLVIVIASYRQTVREYPQGGGSYIVAKENLGLLPGLTAAGAIQISYVLTVAVSVTAGAIAVTSAVPSLAPYKLPMAIGFIALITLANLRGAKEAGRLCRDPDLRLRRGGRGHPGVGYVALRERRMPARGDGRSPARGGVGTLGAARAPRLLVRSDRSHRGGSDR
ncbi:MAG: hypothetical protein OEW66_01420 [Actinomycetota bacterium]|nr:hypothetical protein [Actinomycetota bacterium]